MEKVISVHFIYLYISNVWYFIFTTITMFNQLLVKILYDNSRQFTFDINNDGKMFLII